MLVLTRKKDERIIIDGKIEIHIMEIEDGKVKIGIKAPKDVIIHRDEVFDKIQASNQEAASSLSGFKNLSDKLKKSI